MPQGIAHFGYGPFVDLTDLFHALDDDRPATHRPRCADPCHERFHHDPRMFAVARLIRTLEHQASVGSTTVDGDAYERVGVDDALSKPTRHPYVTWPKLPVEFEQAVDVPVLPREHDRVNAPHGYNQLTGMPRKGTLVDVMI